MTEEQAAELAQHICRAVERLAEALLVQAAAINRAACALEHQGQPKTYPATTGGSISVG